MSDLPSIEYCNAGSEDRFEPPHSQDITPGLIFDNDKGMPPFYDFFSNLYKDLQGKLNKGQQASAESDALQKEAQDLLEISRNLCQHYGIIIFLPDDHKHVMDVLSFMDMFLGEICSFPREFFLNFQLSPVHVVTDEKEGPAVELNQKYTNLKEYKFILSYKKTETDYLIEINQFVYQALSNTTSKVLANWNIFESHVKRLMKQEEGGQLPAFLRRNDSSSFRLREALTKYSTSAETGNEEFNSCKSIKKSKSKILSRGLTIIDSKDSE